MVATYPRPDGIVGSEHYRVSVTQGGRTQPSFVYAVNAQWKSNRSKDTAWTTFSFDGRVTVQVTKLRGTFSRCRVLPSSRGITPQITGNSVCFDLDRPAKLAVEFDESIEHPLLIFADPPERDLPRRDDPNVVWFAPGVHELAEPLEAKAGQTIYLAGGAYVKGRVTGRDASKVRVIGRGVLSGENFPKGGAHLLHLRGWKTREALIEGVTLINSPHFNIVAEGFQNTVRNVKMIGWWFSTDGVDAGGRGCVEDCFFKVNDDAIKLYFSGTSVRDCVIWQLENGAPFQISWNMPSDQHGLRVSDCDVIRVEHQWKNDNEAVFCAIHGGTARMNDYLFENIRIENARWRLVSLVTKPNEFAPGVTQPGSISNVTFRNITADGPFTLPSRLRGFNAQSRIEAVTFNNVRVNGKFWSNAQDANIEIDPATTSNVRFTPSADRAPQQERGRR
jgi:hypothetical protein